MRKLLRKAGRSLGRGVALLARLVEVLAGVILVVQVLMLTYSVVQGVFEIRPQLLWLSEVTRMGLIPLALLGMALALRSRAHQGIDALTILLPARVQVVVETFDWLVLAAFGAFFAHRGWLYLVDIHGQQERLTNIDWPAWPFYICFPVAGVLVAVFSLEALAQRPARREQPIVPEPVVQGEGAG